MVHEAKIRKNAMRTKQITYFFSKPMPSFNIILKHLCFIIVSFQAFWVKILCNFGIELRICIKKQRKAKEWSRQTKC